LTAVDHILAALLALACLSQLFVHIEPARYSRADFYLAGISTAFLFGAVPVLFWWLEDRPLAGFGLHGWAGGAAGSVAAATLWAAGLIAAVVSIRRGALRSWLLAVYRDYAWIMPRTAGELAASWAASIAAGVGEEIAFRGFLLWYAIALAGAPAGLIASSLLLGCAHSYQRARGMAYASAAGLLLAVVYLASRSLLLVVFMHASWNMASFAAGRIVLGRDGTGEAGRVPL